MLFPVHQREKNKHMKYKFTKVIITRPTMAIYTNKTIASYSKLAKTYTYNKLLIIGSLRLVYLSSQRQPEALNRPWPPQILLPVSSTERIVVLLGQVVVRSAGLPSKASFCPDIFPELDGAEFAPVCTSKITKLNFRHDHGTIDDTYPTSSGNH